MPSDRDSTLTGLAELAQQAAGITRRQDHLVARVRHHGATWQQIADSLGITTQAAHKRYRHLRYDPTSGHTWHETQLAL